jgi:4-diphosphocytidyl-2-C-methyl-D-erythritol kinase
LGGGSSDAAATLLGLNRLFRLGCDRGYLLSLAARLGADVPFFIFSRPARARGIGEELTLISSLPRLWIVMLYPGFSISSRWAYQKFPMTLTKPIETTSIKRSLKDPKTLARLLTNDLERVAIRRYPRIAFLKERLIQEGAVGALMSGSGSSVFGIFATGRRARKGFDRLRKEKGVSTYLVHSLG